MEGVEWRGREWSGVEWWEGEGRAGQGRAGQGRAGQGRAGCPTLKFNLKTYNLILRKSIISAKQIYYESRFNRVGNDIRRTWKTINEILTKNQTKNKFPKVFNDDGSMIADRENIANKFNVFFTNIGEKIAKGINYDGNKNYSHYLNKEIHSSFTLMHIDEAAINKIIYNLPPKSSSGCDGISSKMLKVIAPAIIKPLTLLINQVLNTGTFPDKLKIATVIPIFKKGDPSLFKNYRPISLLPAISKVLEKIIALQLSSYFEKNKLLFDNQYGFCCRLRRGMIHLNSDISGFTSDNHKHSI